MCPQTKMVRVAAQGIVAAMQNVLITREGDVIRKLVGNPVGAFNLLAVLDVAIPIPTDGPSPFKAVGRNDQSAIKPLFESWR